MAFKQAKIDDVKPKLNLLNNTEVLQNAQREEREFLSLILNYRDLMEYAIDDPLINWQLFFYTDNAKIFALAVSYYNRHKSPLTASAIEEITRHSKNPEEERNAIQRVMKEGIAKREDYERLKNNLLDRYNQQCFYEYVFDTSGGDTGLAHKILNATTNQTALISEFQDKIMSLEKRRVGLDEFTKVSSFLECINHVVDDIDDRRKNPEKHYGWMCGWKSIDDVLFGFRPGKYGLVIGYPGGGKTTFMINLALGLAIHGKAKVCYVTVESDGLEIAERMLCNIAEVSSKALKAGGIHIDSETFGKVLKTKEKIRETIGENFILITVPQDTCVTDVLTLIDKKRRSQGFDIVFVDYLDVIASVDRFPDRKDLEIGQVSIRLQSYGKKHNLCMFSAQSFNNETIKTIKKSLSKAKDSGDAEDIKSIIGPDSVGGTQKLSRDCDYMWGLIMGQHYDNLFIYWMKSRTSQKAESFRLRAFLDLCKLVEEEKYIDPSKPGIGDELLDAFITRKQMEEEKEKEENENMLKNAEMVVKVIENKKGIENVKSSYVPGEDDSERNPEDNGNSLNE